MLGVLILLADQTKLNQTKPNTFGCLSAHVRWLISPYLMSCTALESARYCRLFFPPSASAFSILFPLSLVKLPFCRHQQISTSTGQVCLPTISRCRTLFGLWCSVHTHCGSSRLARFLHIFFNCRPWHPSSCPGPTVFCA